MGASVYYNKISLEEETLGGPQQVPCCAPLVCPAEQRDPISASWDLRG